MLALLLTLLGPDLAPSAALAVGHPNSLSASRIDIRGARLVVALEVQVLSLAEVLEGFDEELDGQVTATEIRAAADRIAEYTSAHYRVGARSASGVGGSRVAPTAEPLNGASGPLARLLTPRSIAVSEAPLRAGPFGELEQHVRIDLVYDLPAASTALDVEVDLFGATSPEHRDLCVVVWNGLELEAFDLTSGERRVVQASQAALARGRPAAGRYFRALTGQVRAEWALALFAAVLALGARGPRTGLASVVQLALAASLGLALTRALGVDARFVRFVGLAGPLSLAYVGLDVLVAKEPRGRTLEAWTFGLVLGGWVVHRHLAELARDAATEFHPASQVPAALAGLGLGAAVLCGVGSLAGLVPGGFRRHASRLTGLAALALGVYGFTHVVRA